MAPLKHSNLVRMFGAVWNEGPDKLCLVLEFVQNGSLVDVLVPSSEWSWEYPLFGLAHGIAKCFRYLHHEQPSGDALMHRDLKPANVLVDAQMQPKVRFTKSTRRAQAVFVELFHIASSFPFT